MSKRCWTCGAEVERWSYTCAKCGDLEELRQLRIAAESLSDGEQQTEQISAYSEIFQTVQFHWFEKLLDALTEEFSGIASVVEWGIGEAEWQWLQRTSGLQRLDQQLKTPGQHQANEWRIMAEELRRRGVLDEAEEFYRKAIDLNRLDYRLYIGCAETYLRSGQFDHAKTCLEKSLPHAPAEADFQYKSYSLRLLGHLYACNQQYRDAFAALSKAIELSPNYADGSYDSAQYAALIGQKEKSVALLQRAIAKPLYFSLAQREPNFAAIISEAQSMFFKLSLTSQLSSQYDRGMLEAARYWAKMGILQSCLVLLRQVIARDPKYFSLIEHDRNFSAFQDIRQLLDALTAEASAAIQQVVAEAENALQKAKDASLLATQRAEKFGELDPLQSTLIYADAEKKLTLAKEKIASASYAQLLEMLVNIREVPQICQRAEREALAEQERYADSGISLSFPRLAAFFRFCANLLGVLWNILFWSLFIGIVVAAAELLFAFMVAISYTVFFSGIGVGMFIGLLIGLKMELWRFRGLFR